MDITTDGYGFMLSFGNLVWVPFTFGLQARYLAFHPVDLGLVKSALITAFVLVGIWIFRGSNSEKDNFRNGRNPKSGFISAKHNLLASVPMPGLISADLTFMETKRGTKLLTSGWWGWSRHPVSLPLRFIDRRVPIALSDPLADQCRTTLVTGSWRK